MEFKEFVKKVAGFFDLRTSFYGDENYARCTKYYLDYEENANIQICFNGNECMGTAFYADIVFLKEDCRFVISMTTEEKFIIQENYDNGEINYIADRVDSLGECLAHLIPFRHRKKLTKTDVAVNLFKKGAYVESLAIFAKFKMGFSKEELRIVQIAHEIMCGHGSFYSQLMVDDKTFVENAKQIIRTKYAVSETEM